MGNLALFQSRSFFPSPVANPQASNTSSGIVEHPDDRFFWCYTLLEGSIASANFTITLSMFILMLAFKMFFVDLDDSGTSQILAITVACLSIVYIVSSRKLIQGIQEERVDKFKLWIGTSVLTVILLYFEAIYVFISYSDDLQTLRPDPVSRAISLSLSMFLIILGSILMYCVWGVYLLFRVMSLENSTSITV